MVCSSSRIQFGDSITSSYSNSGKGTASFFLFIEYRNCPHAAQSVRDRLELHYAEARTATPGAFRIHLHRCRKLKRFRNTGLVYVVFCPSLVKDLESVNMNEIDAWVTAKKELFLHVEESVRNHCPDWMEKLQKLCPTRRIGPSLDENVPAPTRQLLRGSGDERRYHNLIRWLLLTLN